jgi:putative transposase
MKKYDRHEQRRRSIRLPAWDYRSPGYYFVTMCTHQRECLFADAEFCDVAANALRRILEQAHAAHIALDEWVVMPNHVHLILIFVDYPAQAELSARREGFANAAAGSLGVVVGRYKTAVTTRINNLRRTPGGRVWQRGYYERIIRNEREWWATQAYIRQNPLRWAEDHDNLDVLLAKMMYHPA